MLSIDDIKNKIAKLEETESIHVLYAVESGSRAWGFESPDSDYDVRFIYIRDVNWYLSIEPRKDTVEILEEEYDLSGWDLPKALELLRKSNPPLLEWFRSPIIYKEEKQFVKDFRSLANRAFDPKSCIFHYLSIARNNYRSYIRNQDKTKFKKYFYVLRALFACQFILEHNEIPPIEFEKLLKHMDLDKDILEVINEALEIKRNNIETTPKKKISLLDHYIEDSIENLEKLTQKMPSKRPILYRDLNDLFRRYIVNNSDYLLS